MGYIIIYIYIYTLYSYIFKVISYQAIGLGDLIVPWLCTSFSRRVGVASPLSSPQFRCWERARKCVKQHLHPSFGGEFGKSGIWGVES